MSDEAERIVITFEPDADALNGRIRQSMTEAQRASASLRLNTLRLLKAAIDNLAIARTDPKRNDYQKAITAGDLYTLIDQQIKAREEAAGLYEKAGRTDRAAQERQEAGVLREFRPAQLDRAAIAEVVREIMVETGPTFKAVMPRAAQRLRGQAEGRLIQEVVRELTGG